MTTQNHIKKIFNIIDLTRANNIAKISKPKESLKEVYANKVKTSKNYIETDVTINSDTLLASQPGSVKKFIDECHPDIKKFIMENKPASIKATIGELVVMTRNGFTIRVSTTGLNTRFVTITDRRRNLVFRDETKCIIKHQEVVH